MERAIKIIWYYCLGRPLKFVFSLIRPVCTPSEKSVVWLRFIGKFSVADGVRKRFYLYNNGYYLESGIFWLGLENFSWENMSRRIWRKLCQEAETIFDIGSNTGIYSILAKQSNPGSTVYAFEPQPNIYRVLKKNNRINGFDIHTENLALSDQAGKLPFFNSGTDAFTLGNSTSGSLNKQWRPEKQNSIMVSVTTLEDFIGENNISKIDLIKIDVETQEYEVLHGYGQLLAIHRPVILLEIQEREIGEKIKFVFDALDYLYFTIDEQRGLTAVKSLGLKEEDRNYLLCPSSEAGRIQEFLTDGIRKQIMG